MVYTCIVTFPKSTEVIRGQNDLLMASYVIFRVFVPPGVVYCTDFELGIRFSFILVEIGSLGHDICQRKVTIFAHF